MRHLSLRQADLERYASMKDKFWKTGSLILVSVLALAPTPAAAQNVELFNLVNELEPVGYGVVAFGDIDQDGQQDLFATGRSPGSAFIRVLRFDALHMVTVGMGLQLSARFVDINQQNVVPLFHASAAWGDLDNDGDLDLLATGATQLDPPYVPETMALINQGGLRMDRVPTGMAGLYGGSIALGDYDNDGDLDALVTGAASPEAPFVSRIYRNEGGSDGVWRGFAPVEAGLEGKAYGTGAWGDYDADGDLDILLTGASSPADAHYALRIYRNDGDGTFTDTGVVLPGFFGSTAAWGDYDADGDLDILVSGTRPAPGAIARGAARIYRNDGGDAYTDVGATLAGLGHGGAAWGDVDNDGDLDAVVGGVEGVLAPGSAGVRQAEAYVAVYLNEGGDVFRHAVRRPGAVFSAIRPADFDADGDLDVLASGYGQVGASALLHNQARLLNTPPAPPTGLAHVVDGGAVTLSWDRSTDAQTPSPGLTYNLRVGRTPEGSEAVSAMAIPATGQRLVSAPGNAGPGARWTLRGLAPGTYYWTVQALDASYTGSLFAEPQRFVVP